MHQDDEVIITNNISNTGNVITSVCSSVHVVVSRLSSEVSYILASTIACEQVMIMAHGGSKGKVVLKADL